MFSIRRFQVLLSLLFRRETVETELDAEVQAFFDAMVERYIEQGLSAEEARRFARLNFEHPEQVKEKVRDRRTGAMFSSFLRDVKYAWRTLRKSPAFTSVTILTLGLGIGATTAIFSVVYAVLLRPLPYRDPGRLVSLIPTSRDQVKEEFLFPDYEFLRAQSRSFENIAVFYKNTGFSRVTLTGTSEPESVKGGYVSANLFPLLGMTPHLGRPFTSEEETQSARVVVLSHRLWQRRFASRPDILGRTLAIDNVLFQVIGVMPEDFQIPDRDSQFWAPITTNRFWLDRPESDRPAKRTRTRGFYARWNLVARLKPAVSLEQAQAEMRWFGPQLQGREPDLNEGLSLTALPLQVEVSGPTRLALSVLLAAVSGLLLIACVNAAHLMLAHGMGRAHEVAVRLSLGASRGALVRFILIESLILSVLAGSFGVVIAVPATRALVIFGPADIPRLEQAGVNTEILVFTLGLSCLTALLCGFLPAWKLSRSSPHEVLKAGGHRSSTGAGVRRTRASLVMVECALTVILLSGAVLLMRSFIAVQSVDPGFHPEQVLTVRVQLPSGTHHDSLYDEALQRIKMVSGVRQAGAIDDLFESGTTDLGSVHISEPPSIVAGQLRVWANWKRIRGDYFQAMGISLLQGRYFTFQDHAHAPLAAIIDQSMARHYWPGESAIGKRFRGWDKRGYHDDPLFVVGIIRGTRSHGREVAPTPHVYQPADQDNFEKATQDLVIRTEGDPNKLSATIREIVRSLDSTAIVSRITTLEEQLDQQISPRRFQTWLLGVFSALALTLASVGLYGVMQYMVVQRRQEIGIRMALGAAPGRLLRMILQEGALLVIPGLIAGLVGARWLTTLLSGILFGITPSDPWTYGGVAALLMTVATAAVMVPAWHAAKVDPLTALRQD